MKYRNKWIVIWVIINIILIGNYIFHSYSIRCEPCIEGAPCSPCETSYMEKFWIYFAGWNVISGLVYTIIRKYK